MDQIVQSDNEENGSDGFKIVHLKTPNWKVKRRQTSPSRDYFKKEEIGPS